MSRLSENSREAKTKHFTDTRDTAQVAPADLVALLSTKRPAKRNAPHELLVFRIFHFGTLAGR
jgi:hypothetical protein